MRTSFIVLRYELYNVLRSKWLYAYTALLALCTFGFVHVADDPKNSELSLISIINFIIPLVGVLFTTTYWYNSERFTELMLSQPVSRHKLFWSRIVAVFLSLAVSLVLGLVLPLVFHNHENVGVLWLFLGAIFLTIIFCSIGALIATCATEKMWGIGSAIGVWFYTLFIHDALVLVMLIRYRDYPLDIMSAIACALNPIGLVRLGLLLQFDAPLLLGHSGAIIRKMVEEHSSYWALSPIALFWLFVPLLLSWRKFSHQDF